ILDELHTIVLRLAQQQEGEGWKRRSTEYSILNEYQRLVDKNSIEEIKGLKDLPEDFKSVLGL
ncbi:MAG: hypothetical protein QW279_13160, partial [Candidatus Jordarchaeaceae archaeon]